MIAQSNTEMNNAFSQHALLTGVHEKAPTYIAEIIISFPGMQCEQNNGSMRLSFSRNNGRLRHRFPDMHFYNDGWVYSTILYSRLMLSGLLSPVDCTRQAPG